MLLCRIVSVGKIHFPNLFSNEKNKITNMDCLGSAFIPRSCGDLQSF